MGGQALGLLDSDQPLGKAQSCLDRVYNTPFSPLGVLTGERMSPLKRLMGTGLRR